MRLYVTAALGIIAAVFIALFVVQSFVDDELIDIQRQRADEIQAQYDALYDQCQTERGNAAYWYELAQHYSDELDALIAKGEE